MRYCSKCGAQLSENTNFCNNCGTPVNSQSNQNNMGGSIPVNSQLNQSNIGGNIPAINNRNIAVQIILSIVTCGLYGIYWMITLTDDTNSLVDNKTASGGMTILLILITCGIYTFYWYYKLGQKLYQAGQKYNKDISDNSVLYLVLAVLGLGIVSECLVQSELNKFADAK